MPSALLSRCDREWSDTEHVGVGQAPASGEDVPDHGGVLDCDKIEAVWSRIACPGLSDDVHFFLRVVTLAGGTLLGRPQLLRLDHSIASSESSTMTACR